MAMPDSFDDIQKLHGKDFGEQDLTEQAQSRLKLAHAWRLTGRIEQAIAGYRQVLQLQPDCLEAYARCGPLLIDQGCLEEAIQHYSQALFYYSNIEQFHKQLIHLLIKIKGFEAAFEYYDLRRASEEVLEIKQDDILCCIVVRNESLRLPYLLQYYRQKGVDRFLIVNNNSTDETGSYLQTQADVMVWNSNYSFNQANFGSAWFELLLQRYGIDHWCLTIDADEVIIYSDCEARSIKDLCADLDRQYKRAFPAILLDMYSDRPIRETIYQAGQDFLDVCPYFDKVPFHKKDVETQSSYLGQMHYVGGMRERVFGSEGDYYLNKVPLIKYHPYMLLNGGQHFIGTFEDQISDETGVLLHFKYLESFVAYVESEINRQEHHGNAFQYKQYAKKLNQFHDLSLYDKEISIRFKDSQQLVQLGLMKSGCSNDFFKKKSSFRSTNNILIYSNRTGAYGVGQWNHRLLLALQKENYCISCVQPRLEDQLFLDRQKLGISHHWLKPGQNITLFNDREIANWSEPFNIFNKTNPRIIVFVNGEPCSNLTAMEVARDLKIPFIIVLHCVTETWANLLSPYIERISAIYNHAEAVVTVSHDNLNLLHQKFSLSQDLGQVIYNGRPNIYFEPKDKKNRKRIRESLNVPDDAIACLTTARLDPCKGYQYQLKVLQHLQQHAFFSDLYFLWAGTGNDDARLKKLVKDLGFQNRIQFLGERNDIPDLLDAADIFILPSQFEGMPLAIMEAMAKGVPVIASAVSGIPEELGNTGALLPDPAIDSEATVRVLADTLASWASRPELLPQLGAACKQRAEAVFREKPMIESYLGLIRKVLSKHDVS